MALLLIAATRLPVLGRGLEIWLRTLGAASSMNPKDPCRLGEFAPLDRGGNGKSAEEALGDNAPEPNLPLDSRFIVLGLRRGGVAEIGKRHGEGGGAKACDDGLLDNVDALGRFLRTVADGSVRVSLGVDPEATEDTVPLRDSLGDRRGVSRRKICRSVSKPKSDTCGSS